MGWSVLSRKAGYHGIRARRASQQCKQIISCRESHYRGWQPVAHRFRCRRGGRRDRSSVGGGERRGDRRRGGLSVAARTRPEWRVGVAGSPAQSRDEVDTAPRLVLSKASAVENERNQGAKPVDSDAGRPAGHFTSFTLAEPNAGGTERRPELGGGDCAWRDAADGVGAAQRPAQG